MYLKTKENSMIDLFKTSQNSEETQIQINIITQARNTVHGKTNNTFMGSPQEDLIQDESTSLLAAESPLIKSIEGKKPVISK